MHVAPKGPRFRDNHLHKIRSLQQVGPIRLAGTCCKAHRLKPFDATRFSRLRSRGCHRCRLSPARSGKERFSMRTIWLSLLLSTALSAASGQALAGETRARQILDRFEHANQWRDHIMVAAHRAGSMQAGKTLYAE